MNEDIGWISLHRKIFEWEWWDCHNTTRFFIYCLLRANHKDKPWRGIIIKRGSFVSSIEGMSKESFLSPMQVRKCIEKLTLTNDVTKLSEANYTIITITNYEKYQERNKRLTNEEQTTNKRVTTNNNGNNDNNGNKEYNVILKNAVDAYNDLAEKINLPKVQKLTAPRKAKLKKRLQDCGGLDGWMTALLKIEQSDFCAGRRTDFKANFDFLLQESSFVKLMEGSYDNNGQHNNAKRSKLDDAIQSARDWLDEG